ncbi:MAG: hypothetical protein U0031_06985 [Thermomicrobiales bacterium]
MENNRFDRLVMSFSRVTRRSVVAAGAASAIGMFFGRTPDAGAKKVLKCNKRQPCPPGLVCKRRKCEHCVSDGDCTNDDICRRGRCEHCASGRTGCEGQCLDLSVCPQDEQHVHCNNSDACICTRIADNNNTRFCAVADTCEIHCGPDNVCPGNRTCVMTCCDGPGNAGLRCLPSCE